MLELSEVWDFHTDIRWLVLKDPKHNAFSHKQLDLPTCRRLGGVFSATGCFATDGRAEQWEKLKEEVETIRHMEGLQMVFSAGDVAGTGRQVLHAEGVYFIQEERDLGDLETLWALGFRSLGPLYNEDNALGGGAKGDSHRGLTPLGRQFFARAWKAGFMLDCAHCNHKTQAEATDLALELGFPLHYSHGLLDQPVLEYFGQRGLPRAQVKRIAQTGGLIGLAPHPGFQGYFTRLLEEVAYLTEHVPAHAVLGSDFTGITTPPITYQGSPSAAQTPDFAARLASAHGENFARDFCGRTLKKMLERALPQ